ncbi:hypothetical protein SYNTR_1261 [Candidatus Syntrophocurvum alkaliphilum]|uniref:Bacteriocin/lantibiotic efflux ABC transporter, permease/ATP-binding protein n=1 Tax=Candidatus Syntrophocurvum alkaliphilum TaxID=2293317 RepID=A0A6I6DJ69_9FIRM|nr:NHLP bacteriocin export ABC transporter permease/ATPase subunit [Candidatus Syntrophocurvum alkaliphilum]QGT99854.1 hypothetical protein SYNTR_1261 [Candidatus Syntrophocurvum alkaliphilum]
MELFNNLQYKELEVGSNNPFHLNNQNIWFVTDGKVDLFITKVLSDNTTGSRNYLFTVNKGEIIYGMDSTVIDDEKYSLLAVGHTDTKLLEIDINHLANNITKNNWNELVKLLKQWTSKWDSQNIIYNYEIDWNNEALINNVNNFNQDVFKQILEKTLLAKKDELLRNKLKIEKDKSQMSSGLHKLKSTLKLDESPDLISEDEAIDNLLFKACLAVGEAKKIKIFPSHEMKKQNFESKDLLGDIAQASQIRTRQILLKDTWWKEDNGALLAYKEEDKKPVALIPKSPREYIMYDPANESRVLVDKQIASLISVEAYTFYRPLPSKVIGIKDLLNYLADGIWKSDMYTVFIMGILGGLLGVLTPIVTGQIFDNIIPDGDSVLLTQVGFLLMAISVAIFAFNLTRSFAMHRIEGRTEADLQAAIWDRLLSLPAAFFKDYSSGELANRAMGISEIRSILSGAVANSLIAGIFSIFYFLLLFYYSWRLALIVTAVVIVVIGVTLLFGFLQIRYERQLVDLNNILTGKIFGLLSGISKIKTSGAEKRAFNNWAEDFSKTRDVTYRKENLANKLEVFNSTANIIATGIIFYSMMRVQGINLSAGQFIAFNAAFSSFLRAMLEITSVYIQLNVIKPLYERTKPILETLPEYDQQKNDPGELEGKLEVSHVNFRYQEDGPLILDDVVLEINKGDYVGIVGPSGSGKSTLFRLLLGFENPESGQIYYDQQDLQNIDIRAVRRQLGVVLQSSQLMYGSIFDNIVAAHPGLTINDAWEAARMAGMEDDIKSMPMGMHTVVTPSGGTLSGGQKQRLLIARAIISRPKILYFDEATSALDNKTQKIVSESLNNLGATRIVIAHRLSTVANCNKIVVMDKGKVVEQGSYQELFEKGGLFTELAQRQLA